MCVEELVGGGFQYFCAVYPLGGNTIFICLSLSGGCTIPFQLMCTVQTQICCSRDYFKPGFWYSLDISGVVMLHLHIYHIIDTLLNCFPQTIDQTDCCI